MYTILSYILDRNQLLNGKLIDENNRQILQLTIVLLYAHAQLCIQLLMLSRHHNADLVTSYFITQLTAVGIDDLSSNNR